MQSVGDHIETASWPAWSMRMRPMLLIIGAQKSGTTSLFQYLAAHPSVRPPRAKELQHFTKRWERGAHAYARKFPWVWEARGGMTFESSPAYLFFPPAVERAYTMLPHTKLIAILRDPVERAYSHWRHETRAGHEHLGFSEALDAEVDRMGSLLEDWHRDPSTDLSAYWTSSYASRGLYAQQLDRWADRFGRERLLVLRAEDLFARPGVVLSEVLAFLGLEKWEPGTFGVHNAGGGHDPIPADARSRLERTFAQPNDDLARTYGEHLRWA